MTRIISFISRKGGTGKTTNAINLATMLDNLGYRLSVIETDTNYTLSTLRKLELYKTGARTNSVFQILGSDDKHILEDIETLKDKQNLDFIIVDSAGKTTDENLKKLCIKSDAIVITTSLTQNDLLVTYQTIADLNPAVEINPELQIMVLPNRIHSSTKLGTVKSVLEDLKVQIVDSMVPMKNVFSNFSTILPEKEYLNTAKAILKILNNEHVNQEHPERPQPVSAGS